MTVYIEDVNDNVPVFQDTPYEVTVDELTPVGKEPTTFAFKVGVSPTRQTQLLSSSYLRNQSY